MKLRLTHLYVDFVTAQDNGDVLANALEITVPVGDVLVRDTGGHVEHDDTALALDVVAVPETTKLLLTRGIPDIEADRAKVGGERERVHFDTEGGCIQWWRDQSLRTKNLGQQRDSSTYRCTSSRIHPSNDASRLRIISTRSEQA